MLKAETKLVPHRKANLREAAYCSPMTKTNNKAVGPELP